MPSLIRLIPRLAATLALAAMALPPRSEAADPLNTMRSFCRADGHGARLSPSSWNEVADLVTWQLEPAWDRVRLIAGYELGTPRARDGAVEIDVQYTVTAEVTARGVTREGRVETQTYTLVPDGRGGWQLRAPPSLPYVFENQADAEALQALLDPADSEYASSSGFVWQLLRGAGWELPHLDVSALAGSAYLAARRSAEVGDLAIYYDGERPYHVAVVESEDMVVSSTLNGGIRRTPFSAFAGEIRYFRPVNAPPPEGTPSATQAATPQPTQRPPAKRKR
jgi:hypothetical protein